MIDEDNNLIIAGAGSGKTTTIAGKVKYLTEKLGVDKSKILLISFTRKSAKDMIDRIRMKMNIDLPRGKLQEYSAQVRPCCRRP